MRTLCLSSSGLNENTAKVFWECVPKDPADTKAIFVPTAAVASDSAREGIAVCVERLMSMGIPFHNIFLYDLSILLSAGNFANGLGYLKNPLKPHAEKGVPCGEVPRDGEIEADGQVVWIKGGHREIIC